ncbi:MAG: hypothetical protein ABR936_13580 [Bacteroidota bacterium]|jgi:hypothetical protein
MELKEFVAETLTQLTQGVKQAQEQVKEIGGKINPFIMPMLIQKQQIDPRILILGGNVNETVFMIDFDVAVTVTEGEGIKGGAGINVAAIHLGADTQQTSSNTQQSRIKFLIPIVLPNA